MKLLRLTIFLSAVVLMMGGYVASQFAWFSGQAGPYAQRMDAPAIRLLSSVILLAAIVLTVIPPKGEEKA